MAAAFAIRAECSICESRYRDLHAKKKKPPLPHVNPVLLAESIARETSHEVEITCECERDKQWSSGQKKDEHHWLWHVLDKATHRILAFVIGPHTDAVFEELYALLNPFRITHDYPDGWATYQTYFLADKHTRSKRGTQRIARKHLNLRTRIKRLARKTICFSKSCQMHDLVIGLCINRDEFGL
jgi:insertion element IS1 protein InsB